MPTATTTVMIDQDAHDLIAGMQASAERICASAVDPGRLEGWDFALAPAGGEGRVIRISVKTRKAIKKIADRHQATTRAALSECVRRFLSIPARKK